MLRAIFCLVFEYLIIALPCCFSNYLSFMNKQNHEINSLPRNASKYKIAKLILLHTMILLAVVIIPPMTYDMVSKFDVRDVPVLPLIGGITYPMYITYWLAKIKNKRAKFVLLHLVSTLVAIVFSTEFNLLVLFVLPVIVGAIPLALAVFAKVRKIPHLAITSVISSGVSLLAVFFIVLTVLFSLGPVNNMRY
jgi:hypothetical protein